MPPVPNGLRRATISASLVGGESMVHTLYYRQTVPLGTEFDLQDHADTVRNAFTAALTTAQAGVTFASQLSDQTVYRDVTVYDLDPATGAATDLASAPFGPTAKGTRASSLPSEVALVATLDTGAPGRSQRGRIYLGGFAADVLVPNTARLPSSACQAIATALATFMQTSRDQSLDDDAYRACVFSRQRNATRTITRVSVGDVMDVQRRRGNRLVEARSAADVPGE